MKLDARRATAFLRDPGAARVALLHGDDEGMVRARADALTLAVAGAADDAFRVSWLAREDHGRLEEEASAIAMLGGRRVVRVRDAGDGLTAAVERVLGSRGDSLLVLEAAALPRRSRLLAAAEKAANAAAIACYPEEGPALRAAIATRLEAAGVRADADALDWLRDHLGGDHGSTRNEVDKLVLYAGDAKRLDLDDVRTSIGDGAAVSLDDAVYAATAGNAADADRAVERAVEEGQAAVGLLRGLLAHLSRMHQARGPHGRRRLGGRRGGRAAPAGVLEAQGGPGARGRRLAAAAHRRRHGRGAADGAGVQADRRPRPGHGPAPRAGAGAVGAALSATDGLGAPRPRMGRACSKASPLSPSSHPGVVDIQVAAGGLRARDDLQALRLLHGQAGEGDGCVDPVAGPPGAAHDVGPQGRAF